MPNTNFRIAKADGSGSPLYDLSGSPLEPPLDAWPLVEAPPVVRYPEATRYTGQGEPAGMVGQPYTEIGRDVIGITGMTYYNALFDTASSPHADVLVKLYDPHSVSWQVYSGIAQWYTFDMPTIGPYYFTKFRMRITELEVSAF
jgi:hypothetical protein